MWARQCGRAQTDVHRPVLQHRTPPPVVDILERARALISALGVSKELQTLDPAGYLDRLSPLGDLAKTSGRVNSAAWHQVGKLAVEAHFTYRPRVIFPCLYLPCYKPVTVSDA